MSMWDERYGKPDYFYGTDPNDFLRAHAGDIPPGGNVLCLAEGEGRNAVYLAGLGHTVTAVDGSPVGLAKMQRLAQEKGVRVTAIVGDLSAFPITPGHWNAIVSVWVPMPKDLRQRVHAACVTGLCPGGVMILEAYRPKQLDYKTGGPPTADLMTTLPDLQTDFAKLEIIVAHEIDREIHEGVGHNGMSAVVQFVGRKRSK